MNQKRRTSGGRLVLGIVLTVVALVVLCIGGFGVGLWFILDKASDAPRAATHAFVAELAESDADGAYDQLCAGTRARYTREEFRQYLQSQPVPVEAKINGFDIENDHAEIRTVLTLREGGTRRHIFELVDESGGWKVCGDPY